MVEPRTRGARVRQLRRLPDFVVGIFLAVIVFPLSSIQLASTQIGQRIGFIVLATSISWLTWIFLVRSKVIVWESGLEVFNGFIYHWLPWSAIKVGGLGGGVSIILKDGRQIRPVSTLGTLLDILSGNRHQNDVLGLMAEARKSALERDSLLEVERRIKIRWVSLLVFMAVISSFAFIPQ
jgi:hypothetical protein